MKCYWQQLALFICSILNLSWNCCCCCRRRQFSVSSTPIVIVTVFLVLYVVACIRIWNAYLIVLNDSIFELEHKYRHLAYVRKKNPYVSKRQAQNHLSAYFFLSFFLLVFIFPFCAFHLCFFAFPIPFEMYTRILNKISIIIIIVQMMTKKNTRGSYRARSCFALLCSELTQMALLEWCTTNISTHIHRELNKPYFWLDGKAHNTSLVLFTLFCLIFDLVGTKQKSRKTQEQNQKQNQK